VTISKRARRHRLFLLGFPLLFVLMTWPTIVYVFESSVFWLPASNLDIWMKFWDAWRLQSILTDSRNYLFTDLLFYPDGLSLVYHNFSLPHMLVFGALQRALPASNAYNLSFLLIVGVNGAAAYVYLLRLFRLRWLATFGSVIFALSPFVLSQPHHPDVIFIAALPLSLYFLDRGFVEERPLWTGLSALIIASTLYTGMYIYVCLVFIAGLILLGYAKTYWSSAAFWRRIILLALIVGSVSFIRVFPLIEHSASFSEALDKSGGREQGNDLLASFLNPKHPLLPADWRAELAEHRQTMSDGAYLGYLPMLLIGYALWRARDRRRMAPWLALLLLFFVLRLGSELVILGRHFDLIILPKHYLEELLPFLFKPFWDTSLFQIGAALPLAILACFGLLTASNRLSQKKLAVIVSLALAVTLLEYYQPMRSQIVPPDRVRFLNWLSTEEDQANIKLAHWPMGRHESKFYGFHQSLSGYPHVEGLASRTPPAAYNYIDGNIILSAWRRDRPIRCLPAAREPYLEALDQLMADGVSHIIVHQQTSRKPGISASFSGLRPAYADEYTHVYRLGQMYESCDNPSITLPAPFAHIADLARSPAIDADQAMLILSYHPAERIESETFKTLSSTFLYWKGFAHVYSSDGEFQIQSSSPNHGDLRALLSAEKLILLLYNPDQTGAKGLGDLTSALANNFQACGPTIDATNLVAAYYLPAGFDCALLTAAERADVEFDNGVRLANLLYNFDGDTLSIESWWTRLPDEAHGVSIQVFDAAGAKATGGDFVIHNESLARYRLSLAALAPGEYSVKLILYNYHSGKSVAGMVAGRLTRFARELDIGIITVD